MNDKKSAALMLTAGVTMMLMLGFLYAWSVIRVAISGVFPTLTATQLSLNFTILMSTFVLGGFLGGKVSSKYSQRVSLRISAALVLAGLLGASFMEGLAPSAALAVMYVCYGGLAGLGVGFGYNACVAGIAPWFPKRLGLVTGVLLMGVGIGSLLLGLLFERLAAVMGIFAVLRIFAVAEAAVLTAGSFFVRRPPSAPSGAARSTAARRSFTPAQMLSTLSFWIFFVWNMITGSAGMLVINSAANIAVFFGAAASLGLITSLFNGAGRPLTGILLDKLGQFGGMLVLNAALLVSGGLLLTASFTGSAVAMTAGLILTGVCYGGGVTVSAKVISDTYGAEHFAVNTALANFSTVPAAFLGPLLSGVLIDRSGGSYTATFVLFAAMAAANLVIMLLLKLCLARERKAPPAGE